MIRPALAILAAVSALALVGAQSALAHGHHGGRGGVVFVQTNEPSGNQIDVFDRGSDGRLTLAGTYPTGGLGGVAAPGTESDHLASQGSLALAEGGQTLIAVNAGSDTVTSFRVHGDRLQLRSIVSSGGQFPASVAVRDRLVYVLNSGGTGIVQGFWIRGSRLVPISGSARSLGLANSDPRSASDGQRALCWILRIGDVYYVSNTASNNLSSFAVDSSGQPSLLEAVAATTNPGPIDLATSGGYLYAETGMNGTVDEFAVNSDGTLTPIGTVTGLPPGLEGIAAS